MALGRLAAAFLAGIVVGAELQVPAFLVLCAVLALLSLAWVRRRASLALPALIAATFLLGVLRSPQGGSAIGPHDLGAYNGRFVQIDGDVVDEPDVRDTGVNYVVAVRRVTSGRHGVPVAGKVQIHTTRATAMEYGDLVTLTGRLEAPTNGDIPFRDILARRGISSTMRFPRALDRGPADRGPLGWIVPLREWLERGIDAWLPEPEAALLIAITLGARSASLGDLSPLLVATGLIHIIAISGIKVAMVAGTLYAVARRMRSPQLALLLTLVALWTYVLLTGGTLSGIRSALMWTLVFVAAALGRGTVSVLSLGVVVAGMVAFDPTLPWDSPFLLTAVGTGAIIAFAQPLLHRFDRIPSPLRESFCVTVSAQVGTLPIVVAGFHIVSWTGPITNALVLPLLPALILGGFLLGSVSGLVWLAAPLASMIYGLLHAIVLFVTSLAQLLDIPQGTWPRPVTDAYYAVLALLARRLLHRADWNPRGGRSQTYREMIAALLVAASLATVSAVRADAGTSARLTWLGSGNALLVQTGGQSVLIGGSRRPYRLLERLGETLPYGRHTIDLIVVTDPRDAVGLTEVLHHYQVLEVLDVGAEYPTRLYAAWRAALRAHGVPVYALRTGVVVRLKGGQLTAFAPGELYPAVKDSTGIVQVAMGHRSYLVVGDASSAEQEEMLARPLDLRAHILVATGREDVLPGLVRRVRAKAAFASGRTVPGMRITRLDRPRDLP